MGHELLDLNAGVKCVYLDGNTKGRIHRLISERFRGDGQARIAEVRQIVLGHPYLIDDPHEAVLHASALKACKFRAARFEAFRDRFSRREVSVELPENKQGLVQLDLNDFGGRGRVLRLAVPAPRWPLIEIERHIHGGGSQVLLQFWLYSEDKRVIMLVHEHSEILVLKGKDWNRAESQATPTTALREDFMSVIESVFGPEWPDRFHKLFMFQDHREASVFPEVSKKCEALIGPTFRLAQEDRLVARATLQESLDKRHGPRRGPGSLTLDYQAGVRLVLSDNSVRGDAHESEQRVLEGEQSSSDVTPKALS